jgi:hypothetical protein
MLYGMLLNERIGIAVTLRTCDPVVLGKNLGRDGS